MSSRADYNRDLRRGDDSPDRRSGCRFFQGAVMGKIDRQHRNRFGVCRVLSEIFAQPMNESDHRQSMISFSPIANIGAKAAVVATSA